MLKFPSEEVVTLELVHRPADGPVDIGTGFSHLVVQVDNLTATMETLSKAGLRPGSVERPGEPDGPKPHVWPRVNRSAGSVLRLLGELEEFLGGGYRRHRAGPASVER